MATALQDLVTVGHHHMTDTLAHDDPRVLALAVLVPQRHRVHGMTTIATCVMTAILKRDEVEVALAVLTCRPVEWKGAGTDE